MPKPQDIFRLAQQEAVRVTASPQAWQSFLYTAAHNYHTTYLNQLLIHAQRPDAAACASMEYWNTKANRLVMRGSRSITVLQRRQGVAVTKPIFAIGDTTLLSQTRTGGPWEVTDTTRPLLLQGKSDDWLAALAQDGVSNEADRARRMLERNVADSTLQWAQPDEQMQLLQALVTQSAVYMARLRIGLPVRDEDFPVFQSVSQFDTCQISLCLGGYVQATAEPMLNAIGREALRLSRDSIAIKHEPVHNESTPTQLNSREEAVTHDVHEEPRRLPDSEPFPAEPAESLPEPLREAASGISGTERADALRPADAGGHAADELQSNRTDSTADGGQDPARADADHPDAGPQDEPAGLGTADQQPEEAGGGSSPSDAVRNLTESPAQAESEQLPSAFALPEFPPTLLPQLLAAETSSRADNAEYLTFYNKNSLLIDRLRFVRESYKDIFTELLLADDTRVGFHRQDNGLLVWQGAYLTRSAETLLPWRAVANALNDLIEQHELIAAIDPKKLPQVEEQLSFELPDGSPPSAEDNRLEKDDFLTPEKQETVIRSALPVAEYNAPQMDDGSVITDEEVNLALAAGSNFENSKFRIYQQFTTTQGDHAAFLKKEYGSGGRSWDYQSGAHGWVDHGPAGLKLILTNEEGRFERRLPWRAAAKRIAYLIEMQRFLTPQELEQYPAWAAEQQEAASTVRDDPSTVPENRPICAEDSVVYLEDDHRFTVERIGQFDVHLRDEKFPLVGRAISREEFQRQLDANPRNGGMMLYEQQHEALVQAQTEQALSYIEDYLKDEFEITEPDFSDLTRIDLGYTTTEDEKHVIQVYADLEHCTVTKMVDDTLYAQERYGSLDDLNQAVLSNLDFDSLMEIDLDEVEEHEPQENVFLTDEPAAHDPTNYLAPYEPEIPTGAKAKFAANLNAIRTLKQIEQRGTPATEAEQDVLAGYLGWGGLADAFDPNKDSWHSEYEQLKGLLTPEEYAAAQESTLTAFYTPPAVIHAMYRALTRMGCVGGNVLEPSMGVGAFFGHRSGSFDTNNAKLYGVELDSVSGRIAQQLYQKAKIQICGYEKADLPDSFFDLAIGNVPFGQYQVTDRQYDKLHFQIHDYFLAKTVDKLRVGGIMAFITTSGTMDKKSESVRRYLAARCDLIGAVRLPNNYLPVLKKDNLVASAKIEDGWLTFSNLYLGKYYVVERSTGTVIPLREGALAASGTYPTVDSRTNAATGQVAALAASNGQYTDWVYKNQFSTISKSKALDGTWTYDAYYLSYAPGYLCDEHNYYITPSYADEGWYVEKTTFANDTAACNGNYHIHKDNSLTESQDQVAKGNVEISKVVSSSGQSNGLELEGAGFTFYLVSDLSKVEQFDQTRTGSYTLQSILDTYINKEYDNEHPKWDFSGETQAIAKTYEVNADEMAAYNKTLTAAGDNKNGKGDGWQPTGRANEYQLAEIFSNDSGNIRVQGLSYGTYLVVETTTPHDLFQAEPFLVSIDPEQDNNPWGAMATPKDSVMKASDSYQKFTVLDEEIEVYLKITKLDTETGKPVLLPNTAFQIYWLDDNGNYRLENGKPKLVTMTDTVNGHLTKNVDTFYTNEEGILTLPEKLPLGKYRIVETVGPDGFYNEWADSGSYYVDFDISTDRIYKATGDDNENSMDTLVIGENYWNEETLGKLTIRKTGNALTGKIETYDLIDPWMTGEADSDFAYTMRPLAGAEYTITAADDIYTQDRQLDANGSRTLWYAKGDVVAVVTTGDGSADTAVFAPSRTKATYDFLSVIHDGTLGEVSITLPLGSYHVEETNPPYGYVGTTDSYDVTFVWDNQLNDVVMAKSIIKNGDSEQHFDVVRASEASAELAEQQTLGFYNDREHARVGVYKINQETGKYLAGAVFNLYTRDDIYDIDGNKLFSAGDLICTSPETVADGYTYFNCDVPIRGEWYGQSDRLDASTNSGSYFIRELRAPQGYYLNDAEMDVTFTYDGEVLQVLDNTCANKPTEMWVSKRDLTNDEELPGATLIIKDAKDNIVDTWVSTDTPHRVTGLHFDEEYTLTEKRPADGYAVADDIVFRLERKTDADGHQLDEADVYYLKDKKKLWIIPWEEWELLDDATVIMKDDITRVQISKVDIATGKELPGAELVINDKDGNTVAQWVSEDKPHYIEKLPAGEYTLTEITAPNGYQLAESIAFTVLPTGELQTVVMKDVRIPEETPHEDTPSNTPQPTPGSTPAPAPAPASTPTATPAPIPVIPQTGDVFPSALLSAAVFVSIVCFGIFAYKRRKSKMDESKH